MARTPLLSRFQQLFADFDEAERSGRSVPEVQTERWKASLSRRDFLKAGGATFGALAMGGPLASLAAAASAPRIAIVGGGIAGLNAALTLNDAGIASTVYEASGRVGGRMHSDTTTWDNKQTSEHCGELIDSGHKTIRGLANRFNIPVVDLLAAQPVGSTETDFFQGGYYTTTQENQDFNTVWNAVKKDLNAAPFPTTWDNFTLAGFDLDHLSLFDWIESRVPGRAHITDGPASGRRLQHGVRQRDQPAELAQPDLPARLPGQAGQLQHLRPLQRAVPHVRRQRAAAARDRGISPCR